MSENVEFMSTEGFSRINFLENKGIEAIIGSTSIIVENLMHFNMSLLSLCLYY